MPPQTSRRHPVKKFLATVAAGAVLATSLVAVETTVTAPPAEATYATGGDGAYNGQIDWLVWGDENGAPVEDGDDASTTRRVGDQMLITTCEISEIEGPVDLEAYRSGNWDNDGLDNLYNIDGLGPNNTLISGLSNRENQQNLSIEFDIDCVTTLDDVEVEMAGLVIADAEASNADQGELVRATPRQDAGETQWHLIERFRGENCEQGVDAVVGGDGSLTLQPVDDECRDGGVEGGGPIGIGFLEGASAATFEIASNNGKSAIAIGVVLESDFGDAPEIYGSAGALYQSAWEGGRLNQGTTSVFGSDLSTPQTPDITLGSQIDSDAAPFFSDDARGDDNNNLDDEDAVGDLGTIVVAPGQQYEQTVECRGNGAIAGWVDWYDKGGFEEGERSETVTCEDNSATLTWTVPDDVAGTQSFMRLRTAADPDEIVEPTGISTTGEVEDHPITIATRTLTLQKDIEQRYVAGDQFELTVDGADIEPQSATTAGEATGVQEQQVGPVHVSPGSTVELSEQGVGDTSLDHYGSELMRVDSQGGAVSTSGEGLTQEITYPGAAAEGGEHVVCTFTNTALQPSIDLTKTSNPASDTPVDVGDEITYSVTATNDGPLPLDVTVVDDLAEVTPYATLNQDSMTTSIDDAAAPEAPEYQDAEQQLVWGGNLGAGQTVTIEYSVTVTNDGINETLRNVASVTEANPPAGGTPPELPEPQATEHTVNEPEFELHKRVQNVADGEPVNPGDTLVYEIEASNTGDTSLSTFEVTLRDELESMLNFGELNQDSITAQINGAEADPAVHYENQVLSWDGELASGETLTITFEFTVNAASGGQILKNTVTGIAEPPSGEDLTPPPAVTTNPVNEPGFALTKEANPPHGEALSPGTQITYTVTGSNTGDTPLSGVTVTDDLNGVLEHAVLIDEPTANMGGVEFANGIATWEGDLAVREDVILTYTVEINDDAAGVELTNTATGSAVPPGHNPDDPMDPDYPNGPPTTTHYVNDPSISLEKTSDLVTEGPVSVGDTIEYTFVAENTGDVTLTDVGIDDPLPGLSELSYTWPGEENVLEPGQIVEATASLTLTQEHIDGGLVDNTATVEGTPPPVYNPEDPENPTPQDPVTDGSTTVTPLDPDANIDLVKSGVVNAAGEQPVAGDTVDYALTATNTGNVTLSEVSIADGLPGLEDLSYDWSQATGEGVLEPADVVTLTGVYTLTQQDINAGSVMNVGTTIGTPPDVMDPENPDEPGLPADPVEDDDPETVTYDRNPELELVKQLQAGQEFSAAGDTVVYDFVLTNTGTTTLSDLIITDDVLGEDAEYTFAWDDSDAAVEGTLEPGESVTASAPYVLTQADVD